MAGLELALMPADVADDAAVSHAVESTLRATDGHELALTAEAPVSWPSGAFVRVDRLTNEARACIELQRRVRGRDRLARPHDPPLRALAAGRVRAGGRSTRTKSASSASTPTRAFPARAAARRERPSGASHARRRAVPLGGRRPLARSPSARELVPELSFTFDTSHAGLFRSCGRVSKLGLVSDDELELDRWVDELGEHIEVAHVSDAHGLLGEGLPTVPASSTSIPWCRASPARPASSSPRLTSRTPPARPT